MIKNECGMWNSEGGRVESLCAVFLDELLSAPIHNYDGILAVILFSHKDTEC